MNHSPLTKLIASLELMRPANIVTAFADILAGFCAAGGTIHFFGDSQPVIPDGLLLLLISTFGLYGGGVVFNDVFDAELDARERPERAIPSGRISKIFAAILGTVLLVLGVSSAFQVNVTAGMIALFIALFALIYDTKAKHSVVFGPLFMGICRGGNLLLGISILPVLLLQLWPLAFLPLAYIGAITLISQGEVSGGKRISGYIALSIVSSMIIALFLLSFIPGYELLAALPFIILFGIVVIPAFTRAAELPNPEHIKAAVKRGVLSLIILNSGIAAGFGSIVMGIVVILLLPLSILLGKAFAVT